MSKKLSIRKHGFTPIYIQVTPFYYISHEKRHTKQVLIFFTCMYFWRYKLYDCYTLVRYITITVTFINHFLQYTNLQVIIFLTVIPLYNVMYHCMGWGLHINPLSYKHKNYNAFTAEVTLNIIEVCEYNLTTRKYCGSLKGFHNILSVGV